MGKYFTVILLSTILFISTASNLLAATFSLTKIGSLDTQGKQYSQWWYTGSNPKLVGTADANAQVTIAIDTQSNTATADASENWSYVSSTLSTGDHKMVLTSGAQSYSFTLTIGSNAPASTSSNSTTTSTNTSSTTNQLPVTGSVIGLIFLVIVALTGIIFGFIYSPKKLANTRKN
jgi:hypothetical protein